MKTFIEESQTLIRAPVQVVWKTLRQFEAWPTWSSLVKEVRSVPQGWRFRTHGVELVDQFGVIRPKPSSQPYRFNNCCRVACANSGNAESGKGYTELTLISHST